MSLHPYTFVCVSSWRLVSLRACLSPPPPPTLSPYPPHPTCAHHQLACDAECKEIAEDTIAKCEDDFGPVVCLFICRPGQAHVPPHLVGQCIIQFADVESAIKVTVSMPKEPRSGAL